MYKALVFDLDGTLLDTIGDLAAAVNHALSIHGYPTHPTEAVLGMVGNGVASLVARALPGGEENPDFPTVLADFRAYYEVHKDDTTAPYPGILPMLARLRAAGCRMAVVSNKYDLAVKALAAAFFPDTVEVAIGEKEGVARKPAPDGVFAALSELGVPPGEAVYIGDSEVDILTAHNAGLACLSVGWGFRTEAALLAAGAERVYKTPEALLEHILA